MSKPRSLDSSEPADSEGVSQASVSPESAVSHHSLLTVFIFIWGGNFVLAEVALRELSPIAFSVARFLLGASAILAILFVQARNSKGRRRLFPRIERHDWPRLLVVSILGATLAPWLGIEGLGITHGARASLWLALGPAVSAGMGYVWRTEQMGRMGVLGLVLAAAGSIGLAFDGIDPAKGYWLGDLMLLAAICLAAAELHLIKPLAAHYGPTPMVAARTLIGGSIYIVIALPSLVVQPWLALGIWTWVAIIVGGGIGVGVGQWVKVRALHMLGPTRVVLYGNLVPVAALLLAWLTIGTEPSFLELVAGLCIILGAILIQGVDGPRRQRKHLAGHRQEAGTVVPKVVPEGAAKG